MVGCCNAIYSESGWFMTFLYTNVQFFLGTKLYSLGIGAMTVLLILFCLLFSYVLLYFLSWRYVLLFNCMVVLSHGMMGPQWTIECFFVLYRYLYFVLLFMVTHYYVFSFLVVVVCCFPIFSCISSCLRVRPPWQARDLRDEIIMLSLKVDNLEAKVNDVLTLLEKIEERLE